MEAEHVVINNETYETYIYINIYERLTHICQAFLSVGKIF